MPAATEHRVDLPAPLAPSKRGDLPPVDAQVDAVEHLGVAVPRDDPVHGEGGFLHRFGREGLHVVCGERGALRRFLGGVVPFVLGDHTAVDLAFGGGDAGEACLLTLLAQLLLTGEGEDAVGLLCELDRTEAREDRDEEDRGDERLHVTAAQERPRRDPVEHGGATGERESGEQCAAGAADAERDREREPEETREHGRARVRELEREHAEHRATDARDRGGQGEDHDLGAVHRDARRLGRDLRAAHGERGAARRRAHQRVDDEGEQAEHREEQQDLLLQQAEVHLGQVGDLRRSIRACGR